MKKLIFTILYTFANFVQWLIERPIRGRNIALPPGQKYLSADPNEWRPDRVL
jgi:hypothetical protein